MVASAEAVVMSSMEADVSDGEVESNLVVKASDIVAEIELDGIVVAAAGVVLSTDSVVVYFSAVVSSVVEEPGPVEAGVTGMVVAASGILVLAIVVAPEADGVVTILVVAAVIALAA